MINETVPKIKRLWNIPWLFRSVPGIKHHPSLLYQDWEMPGNGRQSDLLRDKKMATFTLNSEKTL